MCKSNSGNTCGGHAEKPKVCSIEGCIGTKHIVRGLCKKHYYDWRNYGEGKGTVECSILDCHNVGQITKGFCKRHYAKFLRYGDPLGGRKTPDGAGERFLKNIPQTDECVLWPYGTSKGYGATSLGGKGRTSASRISLILHVGPPPEEGMHAAHDPLKCNNPLCVNPRHLRWATAEDNIMDRVIVGTISRGTSNAKSKLTEKQVLVAYHAPQTEVIKLSKEFGVHKKTLYSIRRGKTWLWLTNPEKYKALHGLT